MRFSSSILDTQATAAVCTQITDAADSIWSFIHTLPPVSQSHACPNCDTKPSHLNSQLPPAKLCFTPPLWWLPFSCVINMSLCASFPGLLTDQEMQQLTQYGEAIIESHDAQPEGCSYGIEVRSPAASGDSSWKVSHPHGRSTVCPATGVSD